MEIRGRALYNLLRLVAQNDPNVKNWQIEDYRKVATHALFHRLSDLGVDVHLDQLHLLKDQVESPEEMLDLLVSKEASQDIAEQIYLILFELWRRYLLDKEPLSIFCDELDDLMERYDHEDEQVIEDLYEKLCCLADLIESSVDGSQSYSEVLQYIYSYFAHDVESFVLDFSMDLILSGHEGAALELLEGLEEYFRNKKRIELLKLQVAMESDEVDPNHLLTRFGESLLEEKNIEEGVAFLSILLKQNKKHLFQQFYTPFLKQSKGSMRDKIARLALECL